MSEVLSYSLSEYDILKSRVMKGAADFVIKLLSLFLDKLIRKRNLQGVAAISRIYTAMKNVVYENLDPNIQSPVFQFLILKTENGGKIIRPGAQLFLSCLYEDYRDPVGSAIRYQRAHIDGESLEYIFSSMRREMVSYRTKDLKENSLLKLMNEVEDITYTQMYYLYDGRDAVYFCTISGMGEEDVFQNPAVRANIRTSVDIIKANIKRTV